MSALQAPDGARPAPWPARLLFGGSVVCATLAVVLAAAERADARTWVAAVSSLAYLGIGLLGLLLAAHDRRNAASWVLLGASLAAGALPVADLVAPHTTDVGATVLAAVSGLAAAALFSLFTLGVLLFPDGRGHGRLGRALVPIAAVALGALALGDIGSGNGTGGAPRFGAAVGALSEGLLLAALLCTVPLSVLAAVTATLRRRDAEQPGRSGLRLLEGVAWLNAGAFVACAALSAVASMPAWFGIVAEQTGLVFAVAAWFGILRYRLIDLRAASARTLPYLLTSALVFGFAAGAAALLGSLAGERIGASLGAVAAAVLALVLREQLQAIANLLVYGRRIDPATERARRLERALRDSHRLILTARDDERRRIRRDLHDGLGPTLAGLVLGVEHVERHLDDPARTHAELERLREAGQGAVQEVRRIVYALRPPALDSLGLAEAIREQAGLLGAESVDIPELPELPETLEIGVYLIALEAMKNAAIHARPGGFRLRLDARGRLRLEVHDDGPGLPDGYVPGVGIDSMRERAAELGGTLDIRPLRPRGTLVLAEWALP